MDDHGFTLLEALVALAILGIAALATAQMLAAAAIAVHNSRIQTLTTTLASQRLEQLLADDWEAAAPALVPGGSLEADVAGYVDFLDQDGEWIGAAGAPPPGSVFVRRWAIALLPDGGQDARVIRVLVRSVAGDAAGARGGRGEARLITVRTRLAR